MQIQSNELNGTILQHNFNVLTNWCNFSHENHIAHASKGLFTVGDCDSDLFWVQCRLIGAFTVSVCISNCDSDVAIAKFQMGVAPILAISN